MKEEEEEKVMVMAGLWFQCSSCSAPLHSAFNTCTNKGWCWARGGVVCIPWSPLAFSR